jgi:hypothetical protein
MPNQQSSLCGGGSFPQSIGWETLGEIAQAGVSIELHQQGVKANIAITPVRRADVPLAEAEQGPTSNGRGQEPPNYGILLDVDMYDDSPSDIADVKPHLNRSLSLLDDKMLPFIGEVLPLKADGRL